MKLRQISMALLVMFAATTFVQAEKKEPAESKDKHPIYSQTMKSLTGKKIDLKKYQGKVLLMVNVASECGATPQYGPLQKLHQKYSQAGLVVLGFPCNQFGAQEPGTEKEIAQFCKKNYGVDFTMFGKIDVNGEKAAPLYKHLTGKDSGLKGDDVGKVGWNFEKFLVGRDGKVVARFRTSAEPDSTEFLNAIAKELNKPAPKKK
jgi:glutathione peroxidase